MDWLTDNPIANMRGPDFLAFYALFIFVVVVFCSLWSRRQPKPEVQEPLNPSPDPREIAYLRDGESEVLRLIVFELIHRGFLRILEPEKPGGIPKTVQVESPPDSSGLAELEREVFEYFSSPRMARTVVTAGFKEQLETDCMRYRRRLIERGLLFPYPPDSIAAAPVLLGLVTILGVGGYKLAVALSRGHTNVGFLLAMAAISPIILLVSCRRSRVTPRGRAYLARLRQTFAGLRGRASELASKRTLVRRPSIHPSNPQTVSSEPDDDGMLLIVSLYGMSSLKGTSYAPIQKMFAPPASPGGGGGWAGVGGGFGGGCGGGGGGGGGGCGGGCGGG